MWPKIPGTFVCVNRYLTLLQITPIICIRYWMYIQHTLSSMGYRSIISTLFNTRYITSLGLVILLIVSVWCGSMSHGYFFFCKPPHIKEDWVSTLSVMPEERIHSTVVPMHWVRCVTSGAMINYYEQLQQ